MKISLDTNILIDAPHIVFDKDKEFAISFTVIRELDNLKRNPNLKRRAQEAIVNVWSKFEKNEIEILNVPNLLGESPDEKIIQDTKDSNSSILSNDIAVRIIAKAHNVQISSFESNDDIDYNYSGIVKIDGDVNYEKNFIQIKELQVDEFKEFFNVNLKKNQFCIIDRVIEKNDIWVRKDDRVIRISQSMKPFRDAGILDSPLDSEQMCALYSVFDESVPLTILSGKLGTGKTLLALMGALACTRGQKRYRFYEKIVVTRPPITTDQRMRVGFLPGDLSEKLGDWIGGIRSNLKFLLEKTDLQKEERISEEVFKDYFEMINIESIQGVSLHNSILLVDEYQLLDVDALKLVLSRISEGSKVVLIGDHDDQTYGINRGNEGFKVLLKHLGSSDDMYFVKMNNIYRSKLAKFIDEIFN